VRFGGSVAASEPLVRWDWVADRTDEIWAATVEHVQLTLVAVGIGFAIAMVLALVALRWRRTYGPLAGVTGVLYTIPSLALFLVLQPFTGRGFVTAEIGLVSYTLLILLRNIVEGIDGVPAPVREAAEGMGYRPWRRFVSVDLRLATPAVMAGIRIATVTTIGLVTVTALIGAGGYGSFILEGLNRDFSTPVVLGCALSIALAVVFDVLLAGMERAVTPWARRRAA
jgi:osmoprotectant transport system permease protein